MATPRTDARIAPLTPLPCFSRLFDYDAEQCPNFVIGSAQTKAADFGLFDLSDRNANLVAYKHEGRDGDEKLRERRDRAHEALLVERGLGSHVASRQPDR